MDVLKDILINHNDIDISNNDYEAPAGPSETDLQIVVSPGILVAKNYQS